jgi:hypothetical protein
LINSTLSTKDEKMMMMDINNYYLGTPLPTYEYMRLSIWILPDEIIEKYGLKKLAVDGWVYLEIRKGMYGLKQAGILANQLLQKRLKPFGYHPARHTPGIWLHTTKPKAFNLVVNDFAVKYFGEDDAHHLRLCCSMRNASYVKAGLIPHTFAPFSSASKICFWLVFQKWMVMNGEWHDSLTVLNAMNEWRLSVGIVAGPVLLLEILELPRVLHAVKGWHFASIISVVPFLSEEDATGPLIFVLHASNGWSLAVGIVAGPRMSEGYAAGLLLQELHVLYTTNGWRFIAGIAACPVLSEGDDAGHLRCVMHATNGWYLAPWIFTWPFRQAWRVIAPSDVICG